MLQSLNVTKHKLPRIAGYYYPPVHQHADSVTKISTAIYIKEGVEYSLCASPAPNNIAYLHSCAVRVKFHANLAMQFVSVYLPKGPNEFNTEWLRSLQDTHEKILVAGDFNAHAPFWDKECTSVSSNRFVENVVDSSLCLLNDGSITRIPDIATHKPSALDLSFISPVLVPSCKWATHDDTLGSDHLPIIITINEKPELADQQRDKLPKYNYRQADWETFKHILATSDTDGIYHEDINRFYSSFTNVILQAADKTIPKYSSSKSNKHTGNIWWTPACQDAVNVKKEKYKIYIKDKIKQPERHDDYKKAKINCNRVIAQAKRQFWSLFCDNEVSNHKDLSKVWKKLNEMKQGINLPQCSIKVDDNQFPSNSEKAETFVNMFSKSMCLEGLTVQNKIYRIEEETKDIYNDPAPNNSLYINAPITLLELKDAITSLPDKKVSVGLDVVSNTMLKYLPDNCIVVLHRLLEKCWNEGKMPDIWKQSIIVPILKQGKPRHDKTSYRPIALTSHTGKLLERIIMNRLVHYCNKNNVIPINQSGFQKGKSAVDHLVKLTTQIKNQFARRKNVLATFFDIKKAYDQVWHTKLLSKLKSIGLSGHFYQYIKNFLSHRHIQVRVGNSYSTFRSLDMGLPQGSVIAPILFNILLHDLPNNLSKNVTLVQYADDICMWMNVSLKKKTPKRSLNYTKRLYQRELDILNNYINESGLTLSTEKTHMVLFNNGSNPDDMPSFKINNVVIEYKQVVKFVGLLITSKLTWNNHIEQILTKARKSLNLMKIISKQPWGQDNRTLIHLSTSLVRSKLSYAQEAFFSAPKYLLRKLQSVDCKAYKIALGVPCHASCLGTYGEVEKLPLEEYRKLACAKYVVKSSTNDNFSAQEVRVRSDITFPKRARTISSLESIGTYTKDLFDKAKVDPQNTEVQYQITPSPTWETNKAEFEINTTVLKKDMHPNIVAATVKSHIQNKYPSHLKIYTDGSLLENQQAGAAFVIPALKVEKSYFIGKNRSIFVAELVAVLMAVYHILDYPTPIFRVLFCVDSKSVLYALSSSSSKECSNLVKEIQRVIHLLIVKGSQTDFCWVPSHLGFFANEWADRAAKKGAMNEAGSIGLHFPFSVQECNNLLKKTSWDNFIKLLKKDDHHFDSKNHNKTKRITMLNSSIFHESHKTFKTRQIISICHRVKLNAFKTKFSKNVQCICGGPLTSIHVVFECHLLKTHLPNLHYDTFKGVLEDSALLFKIAKGLLGSPIGSLL